MSRSDYSPVRRIKLRIDPDSNTYSNVLWRQIRFTVAEGGLLGRVALGVWLDWRAAVWLLLYGLFMKYLSHGGVPLRQQLGNISEREAKREVRPRAACGTWSPAFPHLPTCAYKLTRWELRNFNYVSEICGNVARGCDRRLEVRSPFALPHQLHPFNPWFCREYLIENQDKSPGQPGLLRSTALWDLLL